MSSLVAILEARAAADPEGLAYGFLDDGERPGDTLLYGELAMRAGNLAAALQEQGEVGERALIFLPAGLAWVEAFWGCLVAGWVAVPAPLTSPLRLPRFLPRLLAIGQDAGPAAILTLARFRPQAEVLLAAMGGKKPAIVAIDELPPATPRRVFAPRAEDLALLQYTSGSTAQARAAMVGHGHLLANLEAIEACQQNDAESVSLSWLPFFHDLGLIVGVLHPLYRGFPAWLMAPTAFLQRPLRWLEAIALLRVTNSGGPNFAFDLCVARSRPEQRAALDLRSWRYAHLGGEMVRANTLEAFGRAFAPSFFRTQALRPGYGLAEATLIVTASERGGPRLVRDLSRRRLTLAGEVAGPANVDDTLTLVGCGRPVGGVELLIVDPETMSPLPALVVGEIWVRGPSVVGAYWRQAEESARVFGAHLASGEGPFLRTGDLGFLENGELFVTGRLKDLIIVRGANHYPQDLEQSAEAADPRLKREGSAAFAVPGADGEKVVLVAELLPAHRAAATGPFGDALIQSLRERLVAEHEVPIAAIALLEPGGLPKTTSGKIRRSACRDAFLAGELATLRLWCDACLA